MLVRFFPFLAWFKSYTVQTLRNDGLAGLTVALVLIPQSMAYAQLAGLPPYYGLYAAFLPPMLAALFGSSRQLATGPVAVVSLMTAASLEPLATKGSPGYISYAIVLALMVGGFQFLLGILRLGLVVNFLSHPVVNGFTNAAAIIIATSQLSKMFGVSVDEATHHYETIIRVLKASYHYTHWPTFFMGAFAFTIMYGLKRLNPKIPNVLVAVVVTTVISWATGFEHNMSVEIHAIQDVQVQDNIQRFNNALADIEPLSKKRTELTKLLEQEKSHHNLINIEETLSDLKIINIQINLLKKEAGLQKETLRSYLFDGVKKSDTIYQFFPKGQQSNNVETDGRTWRLRVGNNPLKINSLTMMSGGQVVGTIPKGLPQFSMPELQLNIVLNLLPFAAIISLLGFMEAISIAKAMAAITGQRLDPNQELIGQGIANMLGAFGQSYPSSGSFSRSAVNLQSGAVTGLSSVFTSFAVVITLLCLTPLLYHLPQSVLAAVIMMAVIGLINISGFVHAWRAQRHDGIISIISFVCTLIFAPHLDKGIMVGVVLSLGVFLYKNMRPKVASLSRHDDETLKDALTHNLMECKYIDLISFEGTLFFANASYLEDKINERIQNNKTLNHIIIAANGINDMDASGEETLSLIVDRLRSARIDVSFCGINETVMTVLKRTHLYEKIGQDHFYPSMETAIYSVYETAHRDSKEKDCPLAVVCRLIRQEK
ncbi:MAG: SulP family inorganic anion transporter [Desulfobacterales bacterium]|nr:SulP family inorganic anion transporter [Desulfobacterales bacterium]